MADKVLDGLIIGVDLDGVCADFYARMREIAAEWFERPLYNLPERGIKTLDEYNSLHRFAVTQRDLFKTTPMIPVKRRTRNAHQSFHRVTDPSVDCDLCLEERQASQESSKASA